MRYILMSLMLSGCITPLVLKQTEVKRFHCTETLIDKKVEPEKAHDICTRTFQKGLE